MLFDEKGAFWKTVKLNLSLIAEQEKVLLQFTTVRIIRRH